MECIVKCERPMQLRSYLRGHLGISSRLLTRLKHQENGILCNGHPIRIIDLVSNGDVLCLTLSEVCSFVGNPALNVPILWESDQMVVYNKPVNMPVHPSAKHRLDTLGNAFVAQYPGHAFHPLFRLDRNTSGLCVVAKSAYMAHQMQDKLQKRYYALVPAGLTGNGRICAPIGRVEASVITRCVRPDGKASATQYRVLWNAPDCTLVECIPETGRTHQIRVHMAHIGFPLLGDDLYGGDCSRISAHALHCGFLTFPDPETHQRVTLTAPLRADMQALLPCDIPFYFM